MNAHEPIIRPATLRWTVAATSFGFALVQLDVTIVNVALPRIGADLGAGVAGLQWIVDGYALVFATFLLTGGFLGDRFGARRVYLGGFAVFALASVLCGLAPGLASLVVGRMLQGIGAAAMVPPSLTLLNHASDHDPRVRAEAIGWWTAAGSISLAAGPIVGGLILGAASWRWIFLVNLPVSALGAWLTLRVPETVRDTPGRGFDPLGQILGIVALGALVGAVIEAKPLGLGHPLVLGGFALGVAAGFGFIIAETRAKTPMLPLRLFHAPGFTIGVLYGMAVSMTYYGLMFILSLYLQHGLGYTARQTGFAYLPLTATFAGVNVLSGVLVARFGSRLPMVFGALLDAIGFALLLRLGANASYWAMLLPFALMPAGMGTGIPAVTSLILSSVPREISGVASAVLNAARQAAGAMGVALFGALAGEGQVGQGHVVDGLHVAATIAVLLLVSIAFLAAVGLRRPAS